MSKAIHSALENYNISRDILDVNFKNINNVHNPHATKIESTILSSPYYNKVSYSTPADRFAWNRIVDTTSKSAYADARYEGLKSYQDIFAGRSPTEAKIVTELNEFLTDADGLASLRDLPSRRSFIDKGQRISESSTQIMDGLKSLRTIAHTNIIKGFEDANTYLQQLFSINDDIMQSARNSGVLLDHYSERNRLISNISELFEIDITFGSKGEAFISLAGSRKEILSPSNYSQFRTEGSFIQEVGKESSSDNLPVYLSSYDKQGQQRSDLLILGGGIDENNIQGGSIAANLELRDITLSSALSSARHIRDVVFGKINQLHNTGSPWPPRESFFSSTMQRNDETLDFQGELSVFLLDENGKQLSGSSGLLHQRKIDFADLRTRNTNGKPSVRDVINELNHQLDVSPSRRRTALGEMGVESDNGGGTVTSDRKFLLNNILLAGVSDINNNSFSFDFELDGNEYFGSTVAITDIVLNGNPPLGLNLPPEFRLERDSNVRTNHGITLNGLNANAVNNITVSVRVTGDNGVISEGVVTFDVDANNLQTLDKRFESSIVLPPVGFKSLAPAHSGVAKVKLVDDNGVEIPEGDNGNSGRIVVETNSPGYRLSFQGGNFNELLGLNDLFIFDGDTVSIRDDIINDPNKLSLGRANASEDTMTIVDQPNQEAVGTMLFDQNFQANDVLVIDGVIFTFGANPGQIPIGMNLDVSIDNLVGAIQQNPKLNVKITAIRQGNNTLHIQANTGGIWANSIGLTAGLAAATASINNGDAANNAVGNLVGGTVKQEQMNIRNFVIEDRSSQIAEEMLELRNDILVIPEFRIGGALAIPEYRGGITGYLTTGLDSLDNQVSDAKSASQVRVSALKSAIRDFRTLYSPKREEDYFNAVQSSGNLTLAANLAMLIINTTKDVHAILSR